MKIQDALRCLAWPERHPSIWMRLVDEEHGTELVEFALCSTLLLTIIFGILGGSLALYSYHYCAEMAREATRYAVVRGSSYTGTSCSTTTTFSCMATTSDVSKFVTSITPLGFQAANLAVNTSWTGKNGSGAACNVANGSNSPGCVVVVAITYTFRYNMPFLPQTPLILSSTSTKTIAQ